MFAVQQSPDPENTQSSSRCWFRDRRSASDRVAFVPLISALRTLNCRQMGNTLGYSLLGKLSKWHGD
ncbi:MAG: hypothetical protein SVX43_13625 [Cyanobacteriota bacterium]|nr:hypothetical protein [Cyanobacteriota bacterium]